MTLAYVFWHRPAAGVEVVDYEARLRAFHAALEHTPPPGFAGSCALRVGHREYEDWYLVADWGALGTLNRHAVTGSRRAPHDAAAAEAGDGAAGVYAPIAGPPGLPVAPAQPHGAWLAKPPGMGYDEFHAALPPGAATWHRQMTLGPAGEYTLRAAEPLDLPWPHTRVEAARVA
jgi:hypothetical protein